MSHVLSGIALGSVLLLFARSSQIDLSHGVHLYGLLVLIGIGASVFYKRAILRGSRPANQPDPR